MFSAQEIKERDAALIVVPSDPPTELWFQLWEDWFTKQAGRSKEGSVRRLFAYARNGAQMEHDARQAATAELAEMLESMARQVRQHEAIERQLVRDDSEVLPCSNDGLLPCPFCGAAGIFHIARTYVAVKCSNRDYDCPVRTLSRECDTKDEARRLWNTRADKEEHES